MEGRYADAAIGYNVDDDVFGYYEIGSQLFPKVTVAVEENKPGIWGQNRIINGALTGN